MANETVVKEENLYLESCNGFLPITSQISVFVLNYCTNCTFKVIFCDTVKRQQRESPESESGTRGCRDPSLQIPDSLQHEWMDVEQIPDVIASCKLPASMTVDSLLCNVGLCTVLRRIIWQSHNIFPERNLLALLGYQQSCLKGFAEASGWTKFCEIELPRDVKNYVQNSDTVPMTVSKLEKCFLLPVKISNQKQHQRVLKKSLAEKERKRLMEGISGRYSKRKDQVANDGEINYEEGNVDVEKEKVDMEEMIGLKEENIIAVRSKRVNSDVKNPDHETGKPTKKSKVVNVAEPDCHKDPQHLTTSHHCTKLNHGEAPLPELQHLFAEGISMTLTDLVAFPCVHLLLDQAMQSNHLVMFGQNPLVLKWYHMMWGFQEVKQCAEDCGMKMIVPPTEDLPTITSNNDQPKPDTPNVQGMKEAKPVSKRGMRMAIQRKVPIILERLINGGINLHYDNHPACAIQIHWDQLPPPVHPTYGGVPDGRSERKCQQIENIVAAVKLMAEAGDQIVDFCSGGGHLGIVLASVLPECHVIMVESKETSLRKGLNRVQELSLNNVTFYLGNIDYYHGQFQIGVSLHACGVATDMVITRCIENGASFVSSPCCYGAVRDTHVITYPRSQKYKDLPLSQEDYTIIAHAAEHTTWDFESESAQQAKSCMACIDTDRSLYARHHRYQVWMTTMQPHTCSPKNNLLIGMATNKQHKISHREADDQD